jgi:hypothetical protein
VTSLGKLIHDLANRMNLAGLAAQLLAEGDLPPSMMRAQLQALKQELEAAIDVVHTMQTVVRNASEKPERHRPAS